MKLTASRDGGQSHTLSAGSMAFLEHLRLQGRAEATVRAHRNAFGQFGKFWGDRDLRDVTAGDLETYARQVLTRVSRETAYLYLAAIRTLFRFLVARDQLLLDPSAGLPMPKMHDRLTGRILSPSEMTRLIESPDHSKPVGLRDRAILEVLYSTAIRRDELVRLALPDVDLEGGALRIEHGKGGKGRVVPLGKVAADWLGRYIRSARPALLGRRDDPGTVFLSKRGLPMDGNSVREVLRRWARAAGIEMSVSPHTFRRSCATAMIRNRANPGHVKDILGHDDFRPSGPTSIWRSWTSRTPTEDFIPGNSRMTRVTRGLCRRDPSKVVLELHHF